MDSIDTTKNIINIKSIHLEGNGLKSFFDGLSNAKTLHCRKYKRAHAFLKSIRLKVNEMVGLEFELTYFEAAV